MKRRVVGFIFILILSVIINNISLNKIFSLPDQFYVSYEEIAKSNKDKEFGQFINISLKENDIQTSQDKKDSGEIVFKLFGFIPIKKVNVKILPEQEVYVGGCPIGLSVQTDGAVVVSNSIVIPDSAQIIQNQCFSSGDIIKEINGLPIHCADDIKNAINSIASNKALVKFQTKNEEIEKEISLIKDKTGMYKIGLWVKDNFSGIGTLTFVKDDNGSYQFSALGHPITNGQNDGIMPINGGEIYKCSLIDIVKGEKNNPGELHCVFVPKNKQGCISKNTNVGVFGALENTDNLIDANRKALLGGRLSVKPGNAKIISKVSGMLEEFDIEIIKASYQGTSSDKSFVFRVKDKRLIDLTGGIVQGMSGSPIIQNGKIVGAVTHVFVSDPTKGFGVYSDWMIEQMQ